MNEDEAGAGGSAELEVERFEQDWLGLRSFFVFILVSLDTGPRRPARLNLSDTHVYEP